MNIVAIIPARMASTRYPGKPLEYICGIPMIGHVFQRAKMCQDISSVYVATCDSEISDYITSIGGDVVMTSNKHTRCTDRTAEALLKIEKNTGKKADIVCMIQGDEPMLTMQMISDSVKVFFSDSSVNVVNLMSRIKSLKEFEDPNEVKVVIDSKSNAIYFSREPIPSRKKGTANVPMLKQVCIIPFKRDYLLHFNSLNETPLEKIESVDMMRVIENGGNVRMVMTDQVTYSVDTPQDMMKVESYMKDDPLLRKYN